MKLDIYDKYKKFKLYIAFVLKRKNKYKLSLKDKLIAMYYKCPSDLYHMYNLNKDTIKDYMFEYERILSREIDGNYKILLDNKLLFTRFFEDYINIPEIYNYSIDDKFYDKSGNILQIKDIIDKLDLKKKIIAKPTSGYEGNNVHIIEYIDNKYLLDNKEIEKENLEKQIKKMQNYIFTQFIEQDDYSKDIFDKTTNTIRIITIKDPKTDKFIIPCAVHRFGGEKSGLVDNASKGGYISKINLESGMLEETKTFQDLTPLDKHPDTNKKIKGVIVPHWQEIKNSLINVSEKFPYIPFIAWDIVVTKDSFYVLEANASSGLNIFQIFEPIKKTKLGDFYRHYKIIK